jgi:hypothetical protein
MAEFIQMLTPGVARINTERTRLLFAEKMFLIMRAARGCHYLSTITPVIQPASGAARGYSQPMTRIELRRAAIRTLRAGIIAKHPPGETRDHLLARLEAPIERSPGRAVQLQAALSESPDLRVNQNSKVSP